MKISYKLIGLVSILSATALQPVYAGRVVVAPSGGDYTTITAAMSAINPTAADPYVIEVRPGSYNEAVILKAYVELAGAGANVTTIEPPPSGTAIFFNGVNSTVRGFTLKGPSVGGSIGINSSTASAGGIIENNIISGHGTGIYLYTSSPTIRNNIFKQNGTALSVTQYSAPIIDGNVIISNAFGIELWQYPNPKITDNIITGNSSRDIQANYAGAQAYVIGNVYNTALIQNAPLIRANNYTTSGTPAP